MNSTVDEVCVARCETKTGCVDGVEVGEDFEFEFVGKGGECNFLEFLFFFFLFFF